MRRFLLVAVLGAACDSAPVQHDAEGQVKSKAVAGPATKKPESRVEAKAETAVEPKAKVEPETRAAPEGKAEPEVEDDKEEPRAAVAGKRVRPKVRVHKTAPYEDSCTVELEIAGLPAMRSDGAVFAYEVGDPSDASDNPPRKVVLEAVSKGGTQGGGTFVYDHASCKKTLAHYKALAKELNASFKAHTWREVSGLTTWSYEQDGSAQLDEPVKDRSVEIYHQHGKLIAKVPGVKVLMSRKTDWRIAASEGCTRDPVITEAYYDPPTRRALLIMSYNFGDLCDEADDATIIDVPDAMAAALAKRG